ncbi:MAG TPA: SPOR domain-containing protein [Pyrinomonadaceae bacterium]|nr:SPOR domain-containing protein [Pyrinomonadaceae bacterium]
MSKEKKAGSQERAPLTQGRAVRAAKGGDRYSFGVQMMRVSPAWLVVGGLAFVSLIALCTWLVKPGRADEELAAQIPARNQATNQRLADASKPPAQADTQTAAKLSEQKPTQTETAAAKPAEAKPAAEQKPAAESKPAESKPPQPAPAVAAKFKEDGKFTVQVGSFPEEALAQERVNRLKAAGFDGRVVSAQIPNRGIWYRVQAGRFGDRAEAGRYGSEIRSKGVADGAIVTEVQ